MKKFMTSCVTILTLANLTYAKPQSPMSAQEIVDRMAEVYTSCRTYADEGDVTMGLEGMRFSELRRQPFSTAFVRPSRFRFDLGSREGKQESDRYIAWKDGDFERSWWPSNRTRILNDMNRRYIVAYYPTNRTRDGKRRTVSIEVRGHPEYVILGRKTYFSREPE